MAYKSFNLRLKMLTHDWLNSKSHVTTYFLKYCKPNLTDCFANRKVHWHRIATVRISVPLLFCLCSYLFLFPSDECAFIIDWEGVCIFRGNAQAAMLYLVFARFRT